MAIILLAVGLLAMHTASAARSLPGQWVAALAVSQGACSVSTLQQHLEGRGFTPVSVSLEGSDALSVVARCVGEDHRDCQVELVSALKEGCVLRVGPVRLLRPKPRSLRGLGWTMAAVPLAAAVIFFMAGRVARSAAAQAGGTVGALPPH